MRRIALVVMSVLVAASALTSCGETAPTKADYKKQFDPVSQEIRDLGNSVGDAVQNAGTRTDDELTTQFAALSKQTRTLAVTVSKLEAPDGELQKGQEALVNALRDAARNLQSISAAASAGNADAAKAETVELGTVTSPKIRKAREAIEAQLEP